MKRILTSFLAIILATANPIYLNTASAATVDSSYALDNHFSSDPTSMEVSTILDVKIEDSNAEVTFETTKNAVLSVILYDDEGTTVYACGSAEVSAGEKKSHRSDSHRQRDICTAEQSQKMDYMYGALLMAMLFHFLKKSRLYHRPDMNERQYLS